MSYLGYRGDDADTPFGDFYRPEMAQLPGRSRGRRLPGLDERTGSQDFQCPDECDYAHSERR
jgi:hypothetical protein